MNNAELELVIKRLDKDLGLNKEEIKMWLNTPPFNFSNCTPLEYLQTGLFHIIINKIDSLKEIK